VSWLWRSVACSSFPLAACTCVHVGSRSMPRTVRAVLYDESRLTIDCDPLVIRMDQVSKSTIVYTPMHIRRAASCWWTPSTGSQLYDWPTRHAAAAACVGDELLPTTTHRCPPPGPAHRGYYYFLLQIKSTSRKSRHPPSLFRCMANDSSCCATTRKQTRKIHTHILVLLKTHREREPYIFFIDS
jgi:hypothetical protein